VAKAGTDVPTRYRPQRADSCDIIRGGIGPNPFPPNEVGQATRRPKQNDRMATDTSNDTQLNFGAAVLGWVVPGLGQIVIGERRRGIYAMIGVIGLFLTGLLIGGLDCVDKDEDRLWFAGQVAAGPIALVAAYGNNAFLKQGPPESKVPTPQSQMEQAAGAPPRYVTKAKGLAHANEFGTLLCFLAGLMNLVVVMDAIVRTPGVCPYERRQAPSRQTKPTLPTRAPGASS
jgi:TM2 domain-containing membrane protein YozV